MPNTELLQLMHDAVNPVTSIKSAIKLLKKGGLTAKDQAFLLDGIDNQADLLNNVLDVYYISQKSAETKEDIAATILFDEVVKNFKDGKICIHKDNDDVQLLVDILTVARPLKQARPLDQYRDGYYWSHSSAVIWLAAPNNNSGLPTIRLSEIHKPESHGK